MVIPVLKLAGAIFKSIPSKLGPVAGSVLFLQAMPPQW